MANCKKCGTTWLDVRDAGPCPNCELERLQTIIDKLPKCWRLVDGKRVQDVPITPQMDVWPQRGVIPWGDGQLKATPKTTEEVYVYSETLIRGTYVSPGVLSDSPEAAKAAQEQPDG